MTLSRRLFLRNTACMLAELGFPLQSLAPDVPRGPEEIAKLIFGLIQKPKISGDADDIQKFLAAEFPGRGKYQELNFTTDEGRQSAYYLPPAAKQGNKLLVQYHGRDDLHGTAFALPLYTPALLGLPDDCGILCLEVPGNGKSEANQYGPTIETINQSYISGIKAYEAKTNQNIETISIFGHSLGTLIAAEQTRRDPRVDHLVLIAPFANMLEAAERFAKLSHMEKTFNHYRSNFDPTKYGYDSEAALRAITTRPGMQVMMFRGENDPLSTADDLKTLSAAFPAAKIVSLPGVRHDHIVDDTKDAMKVIGPLKGFFQSTLPVPGARTTPANSPTL